MPNRSWFRRPPLLNIADDRGAGPVVVLIHGIASSSVTFQNVMPLIVDRHRAICIDLLGFGGSPIPEGAEYTLDEHIAAIHRTVRNLRLREPFTLVGHSMGALFAPRYASRFAREVSAVVMVSPPIYLDPAELSQPLDRIRQDFYLRAYRYVRTNQQFTLRNAAAVERLLSIPKAMDITERTWVPFVKSLEHAIESQTTISDLAALRVPADIVVGDLDEFSSPGGLRIAERIRGVTVHRVRASDHLIAPRMAAEVARVIG